MSTTATFIALNAVRTATMSHGIAAGAGLSEFTQAEIIFFKICVGLMIGSSVGGAVAGFWLDKKDRLFACFFLFTMTPMVVACIEAFIYGAWKGVEFILS